jgi:hypothetical protein
MGYFPATVAAALSGKVVRIGYLVHLDFTTTPFRLWLGHGLLETGGHTWSGLGELGSISGMESAIGGTAPQTTFTLSGIDPGLVGKAIDASDEVKGRDVTVYVQFFDPDMQALDDPYAVYAGTMDLSRVKGQGADQRSIEVTAETLFARRALAPFGYLSDRDQQRLFSGDRGLEQVPAMASKTVTWPQF